MDELRINVICKYKTEICMNDIVIQNGAKEFVHMPQRFTVLFVLYMYIYIPPMYTSVL